MSKEWKGNQSSWRSMLGINKRYTNDDRAAGDYYTTEPTAVEQFLRTYKLPCYVGTIWECACGCGMRLLTKQYPCLFEKYLRQLQEEAVVSHIC